VLVNGHKVGTLTVLCWLIAQTDKTRRHVIYNFLQPLQWPNGKWPTAEALSKYPETGKPHVNWSFGMLCHVYPMESHIMFCRTLRCSSQDFWLFTSSSSRSPAGKFKNLFSLAARRAVCMIQFVPLATEPGISLITLTPMKILQRNLNRSTFVVWEMKRNVSVARFIFCCNILISGKIIKEVPGSVASGTHCTFRPRGHYRHLVFACFPVGPIFSCFSAKKKVTLFTRSKNGRVSLCVVCFMREVGGTERWDNFKPNIVVYLT